MQRLLVAIRRDLLEGKNQNGEQWSHARRFIKDNVPGARINRMTFERVLDNGDTVIAVEFSTGEEEPLDDE